MKKPITLRNLSFSVLLFFGVLSANAQLVTSASDDGSAGTLRNQVASATAGDVIIFAPGVSNITLTAGEITIDKNLTITGNLILGTTIDANGASRIFNVTAGNVILNDLMMTNGVADNGGAMTIANANVVINAATITDCTANGVSGSGGAIYVGTGANLVLGNSTLSGNIANRAGGAIESVAGTAVTITNTNLLSNKAGVAPAVAAPGNGGALHITGAGNATITGGTVSMNMAAAEGGGLWNGAGMMTINGTTISENTASGIAADNGGGGIYNLNGGTLMIQNATISQNVANGTAGSGGGILNDVGASLTISNTQITENTSNRAGGGIENNAGFVTLTNVNLDDNITFTAPGNGGGLHISGAGTANITGGTVSDNNAGAEGGGLWNGTLTMTIDGTTISGNMASGAGADQGGGGIYNLNGGILTIQNATISGNMAIGTLGSGGGILNDVGSQLSVSNSTISGNSAIRAGGGIEDNSGTSTILLTNVNLNENTVLGPPGNGGGLHITGGGSVTISGGTVSGNTAALEGGGLWNGGGTMTINNTTITDNETLLGTAADDGGAGIFNNAGTVNGINVTISNNMATGTLGSGGGLLSLAGTVTFTDSSFAANSANRAGGAIEVVAGSLTLTNTGLTNNDVDGGAGTPNPGNGGALHITGVATTNISQCIVSGNQARREGGGLWNQTGSTMTVTDTTIDDNTASGPDVLHGGGGIFNNGGALMLNSSTVSNNTSNGLLGNGGGLHVKAGTAVVMTSTFSGNTTLNNGGGIYNNASLNANAVTIAYNTAANGGGIANNSAVVPMVKNTIVANNTATTGTDVSSATTAFASNDYNLIGTDDANVFTTGTGDIESADPLLGPLANNGGSTLTHALQTNSPAYNAGDVADMFNDQTGSAVFGGIRDIGAFEAQSQLGVEGFVFANAKKSMIYPNPYSSGDLNIRIAGNFGTAVQASVIEIGSGKTVMNFQANTDLNQVNLSDLASGMYMVRLVSGELVETHKLVIN